MEIRRPSGDKAMKQSHTVTGGGSCSRCGDCCRWLPIALVRQCKPHQVQYFRERGLKEADGFFLADTPCRHLLREEPDEGGVTKWACAIYENRPATCRDFCGKTLSSGKRYYIPENCTMADKKSGT
jgi:hypothetical protein